MDKPVPEAIRAQAAAWFAEYDKHNHFPEMLAEDAYVAGYTAARQQGQAAPPSAPVGVEAMLPVAIRAWGEHQANCRFTTLDGSLRKVCEALAQQPAAARGDVRGLVDYDAGLLNDFGGGDVIWWQDYLRAEIERANEFWREQTEQALAAEVVVTRDDDGEIVRVTQGGRIIAATTHAGGKQPAAVDALQLWKRGEDSGDYDTQKKALEARDAILAGQQPAAKNAEIEVLRKVAAIAHAGGLIDMSQHDALSAIRRLTLPYWGKEEKPEQVRAILATQHQEPKP